MIDFGKIEAPVNVNKDFIYSKLDEAQIFRFYFGHFELNKVYPSKFRKDSNPSTGFYVNKAGALIYNDLSTSEKLGAIMFVAKLHNCTYVDALKIVARDFGLVKGNSNLEAIRIMETMQDIDRDIKRNTLIQIKPGKWSANRLKYWSQYEITKDELIREDVYPVDELFVNKAKIYNLDEICFAYYVREKIDNKEFEYLKIYQPYSEKMKWISNIPISVPFGMTKLKYTDHIAIGKAQKDRIVLLKLLPSVIGSQNESISALPDALVDHIKSNFPRRTIIWDADEVGVENCKKFNDKGFGYFNTPKELLSRDIKDVSDYVAAFGMKALETLLKQKGII